jgi:Arc/MetJ family transcription regulator
MPTEKVSLTLDQRLLAEARKAVGVRGLSNFVNGALERALQRDRIAKHLAELRKKHGPLEPDMVEEVRELWPAPEAPAQSRRSA